MIQLCQKRDCAAEATHALKICVPFVDHPEAEATATFPVHVCEEHLDEEEPEKWFECMGADLRALLSLGAKGQKLDYANARMAGVPIASPEYAELQKQQTVRN